MKPSVDHYGYMEWIEKLGLRYLPVEDWRTMKNEWRTSKNGRKPSRNSSRKRYGSASAWIFFTETIFLSKFERDWGRSLPPSSPRRAGLLPPEACCFWRNLLEGPVGLVAICTPIFTKYTPCLFLVILFFVKLRKLTNFVTILVFFP